TIQIVDAAIQISGINSAGFHRCSQFTNQHAKLQLICLCSPFVHDLNGPLDHLLSLNQQCRNLERVIQLIDSSLEFEQAMMCFIGCVPIDSRGVQTAFNLFKDSLVSYSFEN